MRIWMSRSWRDTGLLSNSKSEYISQKNIDEIPWFHWFHREAWLTKKSPKFFFSKSEDVFLVAIYSWYTTHNIHHLWFVSMHCLFPAFFCHVFCYHPMALRVGFFKTKDDGGKFRGRSWGAKFSFLQILGLHPSLAGFRSWEPFVFFLPDWGWTNFL